MILVFPHVSIWVRGEDFVSSHTMAMSLPPARVRDRGDNVFLFISMPNFRIIAFGTVVRSSVLFLVCTVSVSGFFASCQERVGRMCFP